MVLFSLFPQITLVINRRLLNIMQKADISIMVALHTLLEEDRAIISL